MNTLQSQSNTVIRPVLILCTGRQRRCKLAIWLFCRQDGTSQYWCLPAAVLGVAGSQTAAQKLQKEEEDKLGVSRPDVKALREKRRADGSLAASNRGVNLRDQQDKDAILVSSLFLWHYCSKPVPKLAGVHKHAHDCVCPD